MINSGITRRIDDLGRIVVPKELRNNLGIRDGEPLEIFTENKAIIIKKFSQLATFKELSDKYVKIVSDVCKIDMVITDRDKIISSSIEELINKELDDKLKVMIDDREGFISKELINMMGIEGYFSISPIIKSSDSIGLVILVSKVNNIDKYKDIAKIISELIIT